MEIKKIESFQPYGNKKLLDCKVGHKVYKYAQFNTRPIEDCPFATEGCKIACYATSGCHRFPTVKRKREQAYEETLDPNFSARMIYTIETALESKRYKGSTMVLRLHESGDFYSLEYLRKWLNVFKHFSEHKNIIFCFYTKSIEFFDKLTKDERNELKSWIKRGVVAMSVSLDDTSSSKWIVRSAYWRTCIGANIYVATTNPDKWSWTHECRCKNCAECGNCTHADGKLVVCQLHSVTNSQLEKFNQLKFKNL